MNYREVKCSDRLPKDDEAYFVIRKNGDLDVDGLMDTYTDYWTDVYRSWLEPYELPTEEEIEQIIKDVAFRSYMYTKPTLAIHDEQLNMISKAITNLLKVER